MRKLSHSEILELRLNAEEALKANRHPISVILHNVRSLYNVGSFFRTCDSALVAELILCGFTPHPPRKEIEKTALGSINTVPWKYFDSTIDAIQYCKEKSQKILAVEITEKARPYDTLNESDFPAALIFGNELTGIDNEVLEICDDSLLIPMYGVKHSLNVSVSGGIAIFEAVKIYRTYKFKNNNTK